MATVTLWKSEESKALSLCKAYYFGTASPQDFRRAFSWCLKAAQSGAYPEAEHALGFMYATGRGAPKDPVTALEWYRKAADRGYAKSQFSLGLMYYNGSGVKKDDARALYWYKKSAEQNDALAQTNLGSMLENGEGGAQNYPEAIMWYHKAADQGFSMAQNDLGVMYANGRGVQRNLPVAAQWYRKAAEGGLAEAENNLAVMYAKGQGVKQDYFEAVRLYREAAEKSYPPAQLNLGAMYYAGLGVDRDFSTGLYWYNKGLSQKTGPLDGENQPSNTTETTNAHENHPITNGIVKKDPGSSPRGPLGTNLTSGTDGEMVGCGFDSTYVHTTRAKCDTLMREAKERYAQTLASCSSPDKIIDPFSGECVYQLKAIIRIKTEKYCSTATPLYCSEYRSQIARANAKCIEYKSYASAIFFSHMRGIPPEMNRNAILSAMRNGNMNLVSVSELDEILRDAYSKKISETVDHFAYRMYNYCLSTEGLTM